MTEDDLGKLFSSMLDTIIESVIQSRNRPNYSAKRLAGFVGGFYDALVERANEYRVNERDNTEEGRNAGRANFMYRVGVALYDRGNYALAVDLLGEAALLYERMQGKERAEGLYACYGNINYCYRAMGDRIKEEEFALKTLEIEKAAKIYRDDALTKHLLTGRDKDFGWRSRS